VHLNPISTHVSNRWLSSSCDEELDVASSLPFHLAHTCKIGTLSQKRGTCVKEKKIPTNKT
jgi:hypothetical protein